MVSVFFALLIFTLLFGKKLMLYRFLPIIAVVLLVGARCCNELSVINHVNSYSSEMKAFGLVTEVDYYDTSVTYTMKSSIINGNKISTKLQLIDIHGLNLRPGDRVGVIAEKYDRDKQGPNLYPSAYVLRLSEKQEPDRTVAFINAVRENMADPLFENLSYDEATLALAVAVGDKAYMTDAVSDNLRRSGVSHMAVVSGMHLAILTGAFLYVAKRLGLGCKRIGSIGLIAVFLMMIITGFTPSVMRAGLVYIIIFIGMSMCRRPDPLNSLFAAITIILIIDPFAVCNISFQLSCAATFGVLVLSPMLYEKLSRHFSGKLFRAMLSAICLSLSATVMTLPFTVWHFGTLSTVALVTNLVVTYPVTGVLVFTLAAILLSFAPFLCKPFLLLAGICARFTLFVTQELAALPFAEIKFTSRVVPSFATALLAAALAVYCFIKHDKNLC